MSRYTERQYAWVCRTSLPTATIRAAGADIREVHLKSLYDSKYSRHLPETPTWHTDNHPLVEGDFADCVIDYRHPHARLDLAVPSVAGGEEVWPSEAPGWDLRCWTAPTVLQDRSGAETIARLTNPRGYRLAVAVSNESSGRPALGRLAVLLPMMRFVFARDTTHRRALRLAGLPGQGAYSLTTLMEAVQNPADWFGTADWADVPVGVVSPIRVLLGYASAGHSRLDPGVARWAGLGIDAFTYWLWQGDDLAWAEEEKLDWVRVVGNGRTALARAQSWRRQGFAPSSAAPWHRYLSRAVTPAIAGQIRKLEDAGWASDEALWFLLCGNSSPWEDPRVTRAAQSFELFCGWRADGTFAPGFQFTDLGEVAEWSFLPPQWAVASNRADITVEEAQRHEDEGQRPSLEALHFLEAMHLPEKSNQPPF